MDREELLRSARNLYENPGTNEALKVVLEETYTELKESEDERIRKTLIHIVKGACDKYGIKYKGDDITEEKLLAYLERQKDKVVKFDHDREQKPVKVYDNMDDLIADAMIDEISKSDLLDSAKHNRIYWINKHRQKPAEWSEEDLQHKSWILECLADGERKMPEYAEDFRAAYNWLKSLRPQSHWKPSEEQMKVLKAAIVYVESSESNFKWSGSVLESLYNDLKSL